MSTNTRIPPRPPAAPPRATVPTPPAAPPAAVAPPAAPPAAVAPPAAPPAAAPIDPNAAPVAQASGKRRGRKAGSTAAKTEKTLYHGLFAYDETGAPVMVDDGEGNQIPKRVKIAAVPQDFDSKTMEKLKPKDFADEAVFFEFMAAQAQKQVEFFTKKAQKIRAMGSTADKKKASKLLSLREKMLELEAQLRAEGFDIEALTASDEE